MHPIKFTADWLKLEKVGAASNPLLLFLQLVVVGWLKRLNYSLSTAKLQFVLKKIP